MRPYELMCVFDVSLTEDERRDVVGELEHEIVDLDGEIVSSTQYGVRDLAYPIGGVTRGDYRLIRYRGIPDANQELQERLNYRDDLLRYIIVRVENEADLKKFRPEEEQESGEETEEAPAEPSDETEEESAQEDESEVAESTEPPEESEESEEAEESQAV